MAISNIIDYQYKRNKIQESKRRGEQKIEEAQAVHPLERQRQQKLRKKALYGQQVSPGQYQPMFQQGQAQQAQAMGGITAQGLEGSIIAQDVSSRIDAGTRASIAEQARQIAFQNEQSKVAAEQELQESMLKRRGLIEDLAVKRKDLEYETQQAQQDLKHDTRMQMMREMDQRLEANRRKRQKRWEDWHDQNREGTEIEPHSEI